MSAALKRKDTEIGAEDYVDPAPSARLSRKNILALVLTLAGLILAIFFSSRRSSVPTQPVYEAPAPTSLNPITIDDPTQASPSPRPAAYTGGAVATQRTVQDPQKLARFDEARRARPLVRTFPRPANDNTTAPNAPLGQYVVHGSTVIEAALETALHSDRPGPVIARVVRPVRDSKQFRHVLIPAGTKLSGVMQPGALGARIVVAWTRMELPNGEVIALQGLETIETTGEHGLRDKVKRHRVRNFGSAALLALIGGSATYASAQAGAGLAGASLAMELSRSAGDVAQTDRRRAPVVTVPAGYRFLIYVTEDLHFDAPYQ